MVFLYLKVEGKGRGSKGFLGLPGRFCALFHAQMPVTVGHCPLFLVVLFSRAAVEQELCSIA